MCLCTSWRNSNRENPGKKFQRTNLVAAQLNGEIIAPMQYNGTTDAPLFEYWLKQWLLPCLPEDAVIVMDNAAFHRKGKLFEIAEEHHRKLIFLPPYSPELNPIEHFWFKLKQWLQLHIREFNSLDDAIAAFFSCF
ncbi:MAG: transposase [Oscillospiraceae bacterium]|nr:transposase [Oscillospiraceae bacterium]